MKSDSVSASKFAPTFLDRSGPPLDTSAASTPAVPNDAMAPSPFNTLPQPIRPPQTSGLASFSPPLESTSASTTSLFERDTAKVVGSRFALAPSSTTAPSSAILIRRLPLSTTEETIRLMTVFSKDVPTVELIPPELSEDPGYRSAILSFNSSTSALQAKAMLDGKKNVTNDATLIVEVMNKSPRRFTTDLSSAYASTPSMSANVTPGSSVASSRGSARFPFQPFEVGTSENSGKLMNGSLNSNGVPSSAATAIPLATLAPSELGSSEPVSAAQQMQSIFSAQSPIGSHRINDIGLRSGKDLINHDMTSDDETRELLKDPVAYAENNGVTNTASASVAAIASATAASVVTCGGIPATAIPATALNGPGLYSTGPQPPRRATSATNGSPPSIISAAAAATAAAAAAAAAHQQMPYNLAALSLNTNTGPPMPGPMSAYSQLNSPYSPHPGSIPSSAILPSPHSHHLPQGISFHPPYRNHNYPAANPADQNPPCNTLYVGNIPMETSEEELKALFSKQRGYKRLSVRTKGNGPMCFVEFEDVSFATRTLYELYGAMLRGSTRGGIRLSFSKNPLGVRSGQHPSHNTASHGGGGGLNLMGGGLGAGGFAAANGPPPGLTAPPGLPLSRVPYMNMPSMPTGLPSSSVASPYIMTPTSSITNGPSFASSPLPPPGYGAIGSLAGSVNGMSSSNPWANGPSLYYNSVNGSAAAAAAAAAAASISTVSEGSPAPPALPTPPDASDYPPPYMMGK